MNFGAIERLNTIAVYFNVQFIHDFICVLGFVRALEHYKFV